MTSVSPISGSPASVQTDNFTASDNASAPAPATRPTTITTTTTTQKPAGKSKPRKRVNTAEKRNQHNAIERARRETLNGKFIHLARLLPSLATHRRPSKSAIVNGSIAHLGHQREQRLLAARLLRQLTAERDELAAEVNRWRVAGGIPGAVASSSWSEEMEQVCTVEKEVFGTFANVDGEGEGDDAEDEDELMNDLQDQSLNGSQFNINGLITPRSSTDFDAISAHQALFGNMPVPDKATASFNGLSWSQDFAFGLNAAVGTPGMPAPFGDRSSTGSPATSNPGVYTPPPIADALFGQTGQGSSPHSVPSTSAGLMNNDNKPAPIVNQAPIQQWAQQQVLLIQLQRAQQAAASQTQQAQASIPFGAFTPQAINGMFSQIPQPSQQQLFNPTANPTAFTQTMLESMFPQQQSQPPQSAADIEKWRYLALGGNCGRTQAPPSTQDFQTAVRRGMAMGLHMGANYWPDNKGVEGFVA